MNARMNYELTADTAQRIRQAADAAEYAVVSASNGLDMTEGLNIFRPDAHFMDTYGDFAQMCGVSSVLQGLFAQWPNERAHWAFIARFATTEWLDYQPSDTMRRALSLVNETPHFTVTCNMDGRFVRAGEDENRVLETEGSIRYLRCANGCTDEQYPAADTYRTLAAATQNLQVPDDLIPRCPHCGRPLVPAVDEGRALRPDAAYRRTRESFEKFLQTAHGHRILVLELGIGARNRAIKQPLMQLVQQETNATYVTFNYSEVSIPAAIASRSIGVSGDMGAALQAIVPTIQ